MKHPFQAIPHRQKKSALLILTLLTVLLLFVMNWIGVPLITSIAPAGIVSFEFAGNALRVEEILNSWDHWAQLFASLSLGLDYLFMLVYSSAIALACVMAGDALLGMRWLLPSLGVPLAWGQWTAALFDAVENYALIYILTNGVFSPWPEISRFCATIKFTLIALGMLYSLYGFIGHLANRQQRKMIDLSHP